MFPFRSYFAVPPSLMPSVLVELRDKKRSEAYYDARYAHGYMDEWPSETKERLVEVIRGLELARSGDALDFGCGNGTLTDVLREALPGWRVYGSDLSSVAIAQARERQSGCTFFVPGDGVADDVKFDFVFTHHVLEHVYDLGAVAAEMGRLLKPSAAMLHVLPCGNPGSFEHRLCQLRRDGINSANGNRFFFEDEGHVRRLTTEELAAVFAPIGMTVAKAMFTGHLHEAIEWITRSSPAFVWRLTDPTMAVDAEAQRTLTALRRKLFAMSLLRFPLDLLQRRSRKRRKSVSEIALLAAGLPFSALMRPYDRGWRRRARAEWLSRQDEPAGSQQFVYFTRAGAVPSPR